MSSYRFAVLFTSLALVAVAACGGDDGTITPIDAPRIDAPAVDAAIDGTTAVDAAIDGTTAVDAAIDGTTAIDAAIDGTTAIDAAIDGTTTGLAGDTCQTAELITVPGGMGTTTVNGTTVGYSSEYAPDCTGFGTDGPDHVYQITVPPGERLDAAVTPVAGYDAAIYLVGTPAALCDVDPIACLAADDSGGSGVLDNVRFNNTGAAAIDVFIVIDGTATTGNTFMLAATLATIPPAPLGDTCQLAEAITLTAGAATVTGTTVAASGYNDDYQPPSACTDGSVDDGNDHVHSVVVPAGQRLTATVTPTAFDAAIYLIAGPAASCDANPITCLAGHDTGGGGAPETATYDNTTANPVTVEVVIDSYDPSEEGAYSLAVAVATIPTAAPGDTCQTAEALTLTAGTVTVAGTTASASGFSNNYSPQSSCTGFAEVGNDRVYSVSVGAGQDLTATVTPTLSTFDVGVYLVAAPPANCDVAGGIVCLAGDDDGDVGVVETANFHNNTAGAITVLVVIDSYFAGGNGYMLTATVGAPPVGESCQLAPATAAGTSSGSTAGYFNNYNPPLACTGDVEAGRDRAYQVTINPAQTLTATVTPGGGFDPSLYVIAAPAANCDANPMVCLTGTDAGFQDDPETVTYTNATGTPMSVYVIVDSFYRWDEVTYSMQIALTP